MRFSVPAREDGEDPASHPRANAIGAQIRSVKGQQGGVPGRMGAIEPPGMQRCAVLGKSVYRGLLGRKANRQEVLSKEVAIWTQGGPAAELSRTLRSDEFTTVQLPHLIAQASVEWCGRYIFFLHVPKTAGTAFRQSLTKAAGAPSILSYDDLRTCEPHELKRFDFWPVLCGHARIDDFPMRHRGVTTLREPRSRLLSQFRQWQRDPVKGGHPELLRDRERELTKWQEALALPFDMWLDKRGRPQFTRFAQGLSGDEALNRYQKGQQEVRPALNAGLERFDACAWSHDHEGLESALRTITGREDATMSVANEFRPTEYTRPVTITAEARRLLEMFALQDQLLFDMFHDVLGLPKLSQDEADDLFEVTAKRLGFTFA